MADSKDFIIISELRKNSRISLKELSKKTKIPISTIFDRIKNLEKTIIKSKTTIVNFDKLGYNIKTITLIKVDKKEKINLKEHLKGGKSINSVYCIDGDYDFIFSNVFKSIKEMTKFVDNLNENFSLIKIHSYYVVDTIKSESFLTD